MAIYKCCLWVVLGLNHDHNPNQTSKGNSTHQIRVRTLFTTYRYTKLVSRYLVDLAIPRIVDAETKEQTKVDDSMLPEGPVAGTVRPRSELEGRLNNEGDGDQAGAGSDGEPPTKKMKISGAQRRKMAKERNADKKKERGQNKGRRFQRVHDEQEICWKVACGLTCDLGEK